jgi:hypothetical protein
MQDSKLSIIKRVALDVVDTVRDRIINDCDDETILESLPKIRTLCGVNEEDYMSYDDALKELGMGYNRNKLSELAKKHGIKNHKFRHMPIGFHKDDIARLKEILSQENKIG